jgi:hypothetical protein
VRTRNSVSLTRISTCMVVDPHFTDRTIRDSRPLVCVEVFTLGKLVEGVGGLLVGEVPLVGRVLGVVGVVADAVVADGVATDAAAGIVVIDNVAVGIVGFSTG